LKKIVIFLSFLLCISLLLPLPTVYAANAVKYEEGDLMVGDGETTYDMENLNTYYIGDKPEITPSAYSYNNYKTYLNSDCSFEWSVPNTTEGGYTMTAMQGMNVGTTYCYTAKINSSDAYCDVTRINMNTGEKTVMSYYSSPSATSASSNDSMGHANDITVVGVDGVNYMYAATLKTGTAITRLKIDGTKLIRTGFFELFTTAGTSVTASAIKGVKFSGNDICFLIKRGNSFYGCKIPSTATGGSASNPTAVTIYSLFTIDTRNAIVAKSNTSAGTYDVDDWTNQGFGYNKAEGVIYVPIWDSSTPNRNLIITYNVSADIDKWLELTTDQSKRVYPTRTSFMIQNTNFSTYEIESVGFRTSQGTTGDLKLYYNINCSTVASEGVYSCNYTSGSGDMTPLSDNAVLWTTKYNANGGTGTTSNTYHIKGISTKLRANAFTRSGYTFAGWYLNRKSDGKWLYFDADGTARWYTKGSQPKSSVLALYENKRNVSQLTSTNGDTITCYAQWTPNSTGTTSFYIQYDGNGGTGTMADTKVVYGTSTTIRTNAFTRDGYVFSGWSAYRRTNGQWAYKTVNAATISDTWETVDADVSNYMLKTYSDGCTAAKTTATDRDIVTFYAAWSRVKNGVYPTAHVKGTAFSLGGTVESTTDMYSVDVSIKNAAGTVVATQSANPYTSTYSMANVKLDFSTLALGNYTLQVVASFLNGSTPHNVTLLTHSFEVVNPAKLELTDVAISDGAYSLGDTYFKGFGAGNSASALKKLFKYEITVTDANGNTVEDGAIIGTGWTIACGEDSRRTVLTGDLNGDAIISSADLLVINAHITGSTLMVDIYKTAADSNGDGSADSTDSMVLERRLTT